MKLPRKLSIRTFRRSLASIEALPQFAILGIASGLVTGMVIVAFRLCIEWGVSLFASRPEGFEELGMLTAALLPIGGALALIPILALLSKKTRQVGVPHVLERLARHQGHMPMKNALVQFVGGALALATGHSGGREGPAVHLGAAGSSLIGYYLKLPNNSVRILVGCGAAAAISASFNTPIAGVIFSMEVILMEYTIAGFVPVMLAAVVAALVAQLVFGSHPAFEMPPATLGSIQELPLLLVHGLFIGALAALFVRFLLVTHRHAPAALWARLLIAGVTTGLAAMLVPEIMGTGYDTVNLALTGGLALSVLVGATVLKIITSGTAVAMGLPVGVIGPTLFIGAMAGGLMAIVAGELSTDASDPALFVMLGMGAMMGAVLQAPLAALMAVMELTGSPHIILPAMLVIVIACMTASQIFGIKSVFLMQMDQLGMAFRLKPLSLALNRSSVASIMIRDFQRARRNLARVEAEAIASNSPQWLLVHHDGLPEFILRTDDLVHHLNETTDEEIDLQTIPAMRKDVTSVHLQATLAEALDALNDSGVQALYVNRIAERVATQVDGPAAASPVGIVTRADIETHYLS